MESLTWTNVLEVGKLSKVDASKDIYLKRKLP
jgi:hypothetical protein